MITSRAECERAAVSLKLVDTSSTDNYPVDGRPYGCIYASNNWLSVSSSNGHPYTNVACGTHHGGEDYDCICKTSGNLQLSYTSPSHTKLMAGF